MDSVGASKLRQHTGSVLTRVQSGERLLLTLRGRPVAIISPIDQDTIEAATAREAQETEDRGWLAVAEGAFDFWNNDEDAVWDHRFQPDRVPTL